MTLYTITRGLFLVLAFALTAGMTYAGTEPTAVREATPTTPDGVSVDGLIIIAGIVAVVIFLAWVCSRVSDSR